MDAAIMFTWTRPTPGREAKALEVFTDSLTYFGKLAADGKCEEPRTYVAPSGLGMMLIHGDEEELRSIIRSEEFSGLYPKVMFTTPDIKYELVAAGERVQESMQAWSVAGMELGYM